MEALRSQEVSNSLREQQPLSSNLQSAITWEVENEFLDNIHSAIIRRSPGFLRASVPPW